MSTLTKLTSAKKKLRGVPRKRRESFVTLDAMLTVEDWLALSDTKPRYELIEGKLVQKMTTTSDHAWAAGELLYLLKSWGQEKGWMFFPEGMGYKADLRNGFVPDVVGFSPDQKVLPMVTYMTTPFLVVEVLSPDTAKKDRTRKRQFYAAGGIPIFVLVDTSNRTMEIFRLEDNDQINRYGAPEVLAAKDIWQPEEFPGLKLELSKLWMN